MKKNAQVLSVMKDNTECTFEAPDLILVCFVPGSGTYNLNKP